MDKGKLSPKEEALLAAARRDAQARGQAPPRPVSETKPAPTAAERLAELMAEEREQTLEKKKKMRRYGLTISGAILGVFALWVLSSLRRRR